MRQRKVGKSLLALCGLFALLYAAFAWPIVGSSAELNLPGSAQRSRKKGGTRRSYDPAAATPYSRFTHQVAQHKQQECNVCHKVPTANWKEVRKGDAAFPDVTDYPEHSSCLKCHRQQFFEGATPSICRVCHVSPSPRNSQRFPFPNPPEIFDASPKGQTAESGFRVYFPHDKHEGLFGEAAPDRPKDAPQVRGFRPMFASYSQESKKADAPAAKAEGCATCHQTLQPQGDSDQEYVTPPPKDLAETTFWLKKGNFKTSPPGHSACFTCHAPEGGLAPASSDCGTCHRLMTADQSAARKQAHADFDPGMAASMGIKDRTLLDKWRRREAVKFRHEWVVHADLSCTGCHSAARIDTLSDKGPEVPVLSCGGTGSGCHITPKSDDGGVLNAEVDQKKANSAFQCTKCHAVMGRNPVPASHLQALAAIKSK